MLRQGAAPGGGKRPGRALRLAWTALASAWLCPLALADATPADALAYLDPAVAEARQELALRERMLSAGRGPDASLTLNPSVRYGTLAGGTAVFGGAAAPGVPPAWSVDVAVGATIGYSYDPLALSNDRAAVARAAADLAAARRRGVFEALEVHARMLASQLAVSAQGAAVAAAEVAARAAPVRADAGPARLRAARLRLGLEEQRRQLQDLRREASSLGLESPAVYAPLRFVLPEPDIERTAAYRLATLERDRARTAFAYERVFGTVQGLAAGASYATDGVRLGVRAGVIGGRPRAELGVDYPAGEGGWSVEVGATIVLTSDAGRQAEARRRVDRAVSRLAAYVREFPARAARLREQATFAERALALDEEQLGAARAALSRSRPTSGTPAAATGTARLAASGGAAWPAAAPPEGGAWQAAERDAERALYADWARYIRSVHAYLDYIEAPWQARPR